MRHMAVASVVESRGWPPWSNQGMTARRAQKAWAVATLVEVLGLSVGLNHEMQTLGPMTSTDGSRSSTGA